MYMAIIMYEIEPGKTKQSFIFRKDASSVHEALHEFKRQLSKSNCTFIASIVESVDDNFLKDDFDINDPVLH